MAIPQLLVHDRKDTVGVVVVEGGARTADESLVFANTLALGTSGININIGAGAETVTGQGTALTLAIGPPSGVLSLSGQAPALLTVEALGSGAVALSRM